jgi:hypothetical protein
MEGSEDAEIATYIKDADKNKDGSIDFAEFLNLWYDDVSAKAAAQFKKDAKSTVRDKKAGGAAQADAGADVNSTTGCCIVS